MATIKRHKVLEVVKEKHPEAHLIIRVVADDSRVDIYDPNTDTTYFSWSMHMEEHVESMRWVQDISPTQLVIDSFLEQFESDLDTEKSVGLNDII